MQDIWSSWTIYPDIVIGLLLLLGIYLLLSGPLKKNFTVTSIEPKPGQLFLFISGIILFFLTETGPIHDLAEQSSFSMHMLQHVCLTLIIPPLLLGGIPDWMIIPIEKNQWLNKSRKFLSHPLIAFSLFNITFAIWHLPILYELTLKFHAIHIIEHLTFLITSTILWWPILAPIQRFRLNYPMQIGYIFLIPIAQLIVFGPVTFSSNVIYPHYQITENIWGLSTIEDQQLGGVIMKVGSMIIFLVFLTLIFFSWYSKEQSSKNK